MQKVKLKFVYSYNDFPLILQFSEQVKIRLCKDRLFKSIFVLPNLTDSADSNKTYITLFL